MSGKVITTIRSVDRQTDTQTNAGKTLAAVMKVRPMRKYLKSSLTSKVCNVY